MPQATTDGADSLANPAADHTAVAAPHSFVADYYPPSNPPLAGISAAGNADSYAAYGPGSQTDS